MKSEFWIRNAKIINADGCYEADLRVYDSRIAELRERSEESAPLDDPDIDATGLWLLPGGVDAHVHFGMPLNKGIESRSWRDSSTAALLGGTTTVIDFANPAPDESLNTTVSRWHARADQNCLCDYSFHVTVSDLSAGRLAEIPGLVTSGLPTFKAFLAYKDRLMLTPGELGELMRTVAAAGGALWLHAEDGEMNAEIEMRLLGEGKTSARWHPLAHPAESEISAIETALELADATRCPLTIVHLSTAGGLELIREARARNIDVRAEVCIQHLFRNDRLYHGDDLLTAIMSPPLRPSEDASALRDGLTDPSIVQISTDHCEFSTSIKNDATRNGFPFIPNGTAGVGERLIVSYTLGVLQGHLSPERWIDLCCTGPAAHAGLGHRKGRIAQGLDADLVLFDPEAKDTRLPINADASLWRGGNWHGRVVDVWRRGEIVVRDGSLVVGIECGTFLERHRLCP